jgi:hypothetical protein
MNQELQHTQLDGISDYVKALDSVCALAKRSLCLFDKNFEDAGFNSEARYETLRAFLLASSANSLQILAHDTSYLAQRCPRMMTLLRQFSHNMQIHRTPLHLQNVAEPFAVADEAHYVRRFHFDDTRGILAQNDPQGARTLHSKFMEMWASSQQSVSATTLGL